MKIHKNETGPTSFRDQANIGGNWMLRHGKPREAGGGSPSTLTPVFLFHCSLI